MKRGKCPLIKLLCIPEASVLKTGIFSILTFLYVLSAYYQVPWFYYPISVILFALAFAATIVLFTVSDTEIAQHALDRNLGWSMYPNCLINTGVLLYLDWYLAALIYGTMIIMGLIKRLMGLHKLRSQNT
ncbi:hypothetical protein AN389_00331 [Pseudoalteromonas sp. P1-7a]|nr:hypothetical protein AN389_00331 [Pseudoalteromonas sp. P1-7a]